MKCIIAFSFLSIISAISAIKYDREYMQANFDWYCRTVCESAGGKSHLIKEIPCCICKVDDQVKDGERALMTKTADLLGMNFQIYEPKYTKRSVDDTVSNEEEDEDDTKLTPLDKFRLMLRSKFAAHEAPKLGDIHMPENLLPSLQVDNSKFLPFFSRSAAAPQAPSLPKPVIDHAEATRTMLANIRGKLDELIDKTDRNRFDSARAAHEIEKLRASLKEITHINLKPMNLPQVPSLVGLINGKQETTTKSIIVQPDYLPKDEDDEEDE